MQYRVLWSPQAESQLENLLDRADDAEQLADFAREVDRRLFADPDDFSESRFGDVRLGLIRPLGVLFEVHEDIRTVVVYSLWRTDRR